MSINTFEPPPDIHEVPDGFIVFGYAGSHNSGNVSEHHGLYDGWLVKLDKSGNHIWSKCFGGTIHDWIYAGTVNATGEIILASTTKSTDGDIEFHYGGDDIVVVKMNLSGDIVWQKSLGGSLWESCFSIEATVDNGLVLAGHSWSEDGDLSGMEIKGREDLWIVKLAPETTHADAPTTFPLTLFPNPAQQTTTFSVPAGYDLLHVEITDLPGRLLSVQQIQNGENIHLQTLPPGAYFVTALAADGQRFVGKLLKE